MPKFKHFRATSIYNAIDLQLSNSVLSAVVTGKPAWYDVVKSIPPTEAGIRPVVPRDWSSNTSRRPRNLYKPQKLLFLEDRLRNVFYRDHPWELARPRVIAETDGKDHLRCDWSKGLRQPGIGLSGECVIQRQMWLMENEKKSEAQAYDEARKEFYYLRQAEQIEQRIAVEEARHVGAYFGKTRLEIGMHLENEEFERWKGWAIRENHLFDLAEQGMLDETIMGADAGAESIPSNARTEEDEGAAEDVATSADGPVKGEE
ncbi:hypothetical protein GQ602_003752 [Ophiocordyceps camponoti-floridani]|uniref:37S ribosomal protein S25, mitochondrial n=1 Tax=Ophiocordyceps camponoti-floridani TaxID=2030778 RepID=A0A8H4Q8X1_9HYPO|nr:hypothetical protein GQ602_003752 [Ophiocordyceps camponoti-floridani]